MTLLQGGEIIPIGELWRESYVAIHTIESAANLFIDDPYKEISNFIIIIALAIFGIFAFRRVLDGVKYVFSAVINRKMLFTIENQSNIQVCRNTLFLYTSLCVSFVLSNITYATRMIGDEYSVPIKFIGIFIALIIYFGLRRWALKLMGWVNNSSIFKMVEKITYTYVSIWYILILCAFFVIKGIPSLLMGNMRYCLFFSALAVFIPFYFTLFRIFVSKGFSHFFIFLYLCTLEILPMALLLYVSFT